MRESFRLTKGSSLRLAATLLLTAMLFLGTHGALNSSRMMEDTGNAFEYGWQDEARENARDKQIANGEPVTVPEELPNKDDFLDPPPTLIDFLFYVPANVILSMLLILVTAGILAQYYRWVMTRQKPQETA